MLKDCCGKAFSQYFDEEMSFFKNCDGYTASFSPHESDEFIQTQVAHSEPNPIGFEFCEEAEDP
jgi:hypothetical protein